MVLVKDLKFFNPFIFGKIRDKNVFDDILARKKAFLGYKKEKVKKVKNWDFSIFLFLAKSERKMCLTIF